MFQTMNCSDKTDTPGKHSKKTIKRRRMKWLLVFPALICVFMLLTGRAYADAAPTVPGQQGHPISSIPFLREWIEENNRVDAEMELQGFHAEKRILIMEFTEDDEPYHPSRAISAEGNGLHATVVLRIEDAGRDEASSYSITAVLLVNGTPVDFRIDGNSSAGGVLTASMNSNQDYILSLQAENLPVIQGENKLTLTMLGYCEDQDFYLDAQSITGSFVSDRDDDGIALAPCPEDELDIVSIQNKNELGKYAGMPFLSAGEMIDFQSDHYGNVLMTAKADPTMWFYLDNVSMQDLSGNRKGLLFLFIDGELKPIWNGNSIAEVSLHDSDLLKAVRVESGFQAGECHHVYWYYLETESVVNLDWPVSMAFRMKMKIE